MFVLTRNSWERYESSSTVVLAVASTVEALRKHAKQFGCYPEMWEDNGLMCITFEELYDDQEVYSQEYYEIAPVTVV